jgi:PEP-CTERM motif
VDHTTILASYSVGLDASIFTSTDAGESALIGAGSLAEISGQEPWTGIRQSVTFCNPASTPEPGSLSLLAIGVLGQAGLARCKLIP